MVLEGEAVEKKKAEEIMEDFYERYQKTPEGWSFWMSPPTDPSDFYEAYLVHGDEAFFLKLDSIHTPKPIGIGAKFKIKEDQLVKDLPDFGFRKFSQRETENFFKNLPKPEEYESKEKFQEDLKKSQKDIVDKAMRRSPTPFQPLEEPGQLAAIGPYSTKNPLGYLSEKQKKLERELSRELERIIDRSYPGYY